MPRKSKIVVAMRWERGLGFGIKVVLPGDVESFSIVPLWKLVPAFISEVRWVRRGIKSGEIHA